MTTYAYYFFNSENSIVYRKRLPLPHLRFLSIALFSLSLVFLSFSNKNFIEAHTQKIYANLKCTSPRFFTKKVHSCNECPGQEIEYTPEASLVPFPSHSLTYSNLYSNFSLPVFLFSKLFSNLPPDTFSFSILLKCN